MSLIWCKVALWGSFMIPAICAAGAPDKTPTPNTGAVAVDNTNSKFPVKTFDLNDDNQVGALLTEYLAREKQVKDQSEVGLMGVFSVREVDDIDKLFSIYDIVAPYLSVLEIKFMNDIQERKFVPLSAQNQHLKIVISGASDTVKDVTGVSFAIYADNVHVHHLKWGDTFISNVLAVGAKDNLILDNLVFVDNTYDDYNYGNVDPRIIINSIAKDGKMANATIRNLTFKNNKTSALLVIDDEALDKFDTITYENITLTDNKTYRLGMDVSAAKKTILKGVSIAGHSGAPALVQRTPLGNVEIRSSNLTADDYKYVPASKYKDKTPKAPKFVQ
ncbi:MAG: hypothetical protein IJU23_13975 [Proteobacteria bacterium]|nr:hypothetical protein [Pseudomonadota bacterium]